MAPDSAERQIDGFLAKYGPEVAAAARACRKVLHKHVPRGNEFVYDNYNALAAAVEEFDAAGRLTTVVKSVSARQRPRRRGPSAILLRA